jgi:hypothetical protein
MATRAKKVLAGIAALAALAFGGAAIAQAGGGSQDQQAASSPATQPAEQGESAAAENSATDPDNVQDETGNDQGEKGGGPEGSETPDGAEAPEADEQQGSEVPGDDGPGGHADEPSNPNADHQFQGKE